MHQNIQYIRSKTDQLEVFLQDTTPHILAISEHGLKDNEINFIKIEGYYIIGHYYRNKYKGGGIALYISNKIVQVRALDWITTKSIERSIEIVGIELMEEKNIIIIATYRPPCGLLDEFFSCLCSILEKINKSGKRIVILGDLNINIMEKGPGSDQLADISKHL
jgi:exonuclease III